MSSMSVCTWNRHMTLKESGGVCISVTEPPDSLAGVRGGKMYIKLRGVPSGPLSMISPSFANSALNSVQRWLNISAVDASVNVGAVTCPTLAGMPLPATPAPGMASVAQKAPCATLRRSS